uniref:Uncharacterized protein n=1 Tax=Anguilla anguilla TaxID=7936 RepID=A0A0E9SXA1_ANGAN
MVATTVIASDNYHCGISPCLNML